VAVLRTRIRTRALPPLVLALLLLCPGCNSDVFLNVDNGRLTLRVTVNPEDLTLVIGGDAQTVIVAISRQGDTGPVNLALDGVPAGVTAQIQQPGLLNEGRITLRATIDAQPQADVIIGVSASDGAFADTTRLMLDVVPWPGPG
jgi:hypothetical protein